MPAGLGDNLNSQSRLEHIHQFANIQKRLIDASKTFAAATCFGQLPDMYTIGNLPAMIEEEARNHREKL